MYPKFDADIARMNATYKLPEVIGIMKMAARLPQFEDILSKEFAELEDVDRIVDTGGAETADLSVVARKVRVAMADLLADIIVYCASEAKRWRIPLPAIGAVVMASNFSKLDENGEPIINPTNGKFEKGPNYWKPEPLIEKILLAYDAAGGDTKKMMELLEEDATAVLADSVPTEHSQNPQG
jgi:predicted HAD superfamily Cof-like phosphohydrolase